ncbi:hypothetical protein A3D03_01725 [Candidatus Gottesmanbacteria bacterium RIFCSPHIGHO2_02_FULL_40_13]|uniref:RNA polymerase sigma-70 domain-containing protein n=1 Tax=Candidatus Gottesmanbacteria bacterium RIFCSPHIGHO2_02_FULL_40_13 TaxID=1798384 RepID=A0A1F6A6S3_9BACT|nr:MAG: hypothetical protein A3D03_01725 [Candidatus Gottesmanbacteria bacterium RIFCSPHIGHO2_02_FULL_40_13]
MPIELLKTVNLPGETSGISDAPNPAFPDDFEPLTVELAEIEQGLEKDLGNHPLSETALTALVDDGVDLVAMYLEEIRSSPLLTKEEEIALAQTYRKGREAREKLHKAELEHLEVEIKERERLTEEMETGDQAYDTLVLSNRRLVVSMAKKYIGRGLDFLDLIQEGNIGLMMGVKKFDPDRGFRVSTYAAWWIRQTITRAIADQSRTIRLPVSQVAKLRKMQSAIRTLQQNLGRNPNNRELAKALKISKQDLDILLKFQRQQPHSLNLPVGDDAEFGDFIPDTSAPTPDDSAEHTMLAPELSALLSLLTEKQQQVLRLRLGLDGEDEHTLDAVGKLLGLTREGVRQIESKALRQLRMLANKKMLREYL